MSMPWQQPAPWAAHRPGVSWRLMLGVALSIAAAIAGVAFALYETFAPR